MSHAIQTQITPDVITDYFTKVLEDDLKAVIKPQYVDQIPRAVKGADRTVETLLKGRSQLGNFDDIVDAMGLSLSFSIIHSKYS